MPIKGKRLMWWSLIVGTLLTVSPITTTPKPIRNRPAASAETDLKIKPMHRRVMPDTSDAQDMKVALFSIRPTGIEPKETTLISGKYLLVVVNRTGLDEFGFRVDRVNGKNLHEVHFARYKRDEKYFLNLTPGDYVLREASHPQWLSRITVAAR